MSKGLRKLGAAVSNASPLDFLAKIGRLDLLKTFAGRIIIPQHVFLEVVEKAVGKGLPSAAVIQRGVQDGWIEVKDPPEDGLLMQLINVRGVHVGEAYAIRLAKAEGVKHILIDDRVGADLAEVEGLQPIGTVAILIHACRENYIRFPDFIECLSKLERKGFWLRPRVREGAIRLVRLELMRLGREKEVQEAIE